MLIGNYLNKTFEHVYVKNVKEATNRLKSFVDNSQQIDLKYEVFTAIRGDLYVPNDYVVMDRPHLYPFPYNQYIMGNAYTFVAILLDAMRNNYESIVVCDDDTIFYDIDVNDDLFTLPNDWNIINMGSMEYVKPTTNSLSVQLLNSNDSNIITGSQCVAINKNAYYTILSNSLSIGTHGKTGDILFHTLLIENKIKMYKIFPDFTYQERNILTPYVIK